MNKSSNQLLLKVKNNEKQAMMEMVKIEIKSEDMLFNSLNKVKIETNLLYFLS